MYKCYMILTLLIEVLQELNAVLLIVAPSLAPLALIFVHRLVGARAHGFSFIFLPGGGGILPLLLVLSHVDTINTTIVALDPFFLLKTHRYELFKCSFVIHGVVIHLEGLKFLRE
jgi:hypothetical protein